MSDLGEEVKEERVRELKETHTRRYLLKQELITPEEYRTITGESYYKNAEKNSSN